MSGAKPGIVSSAGSAPGLAVRAWCDRDELVVELEDGRIVRHELPDFVKAAATAKRRCEVEDFGTAIWWPELDEGVGINWLFGVSEDVIYDLAGFEKGPF
jgi:uncharacterized protein DUF2442